MLYKSTLKGKDKEPKKIQLEIEIENFGPISQGRITLNPLTIFVGPNNSGKSYAAMLIHSIFESYGPTILPPDVPLFVRRRYFAEYLDIPAFAKEFPDLKAQIDNLEDRKELEIPAELIEKITRATCEGVYEKVLTQEIVRSFASGLKDLIRIGEHNFTLKINSNSYTTHLEYHKNLVKVKECPRIITKIKIRAIESPRIRIKPSEAEDEVIFEIGAPWREKDERRFIHNQIRELVLEVCINKLFENVSIPCHYLPAARSGILQGHKALAASIVRKAPYVGIERLEIPKFSGVVSDFISSILTLPESKGPFFQLAQAFEKELIKGEIIVRTADEYLYPEIKYSFQSTEIPLHRSSSTVSELAPLSLYLKYSIRPGSILIIEEPEAHLHPENQRILAKFLVKLVRKGVNIIITTHSEYLMEQLNSFILLSKIEPRKRVEEYQYAEEDYLRSNEIATYVFEYDRKGQGYKVAQVEITEEEGISQEEFLKIHEALYEESIKLRRELFTEK